MINEVFQLTREHIITHNLKSEAEGLWAWERNGEIFGLCSTRSLAEELARANAPQTQSTEVTLTLRQDQLVELLHIIRSHKISIENNVHIPAIRSWYDRVEDLQDRVTGTLIRSRG